MKTKKVFFNNFVCALLLVLFTSVYAADTYMYSYQCVPYSDCGSATVTMHCRYTPQGGACYECTGSGPMTICTFICNYEGYCIWNGGLPSCGHPKYGTCVRSGETLMCVGQNTDLSRTCNGYDCN
jgi:hypothetical protein